MTGTSDMPWRRCPGGSRHDRHGLRERCRSPQHPAAAGVGPAMGYPTRCGGSPQRVLQPEARGRRVLRRDPRAVPVHLKLRPFGCLAPTRKGATCAQVAVAGASRHVSGWAVAGTRSSRHRDSELRMRPGPMRERALASTEASFVFLVTATCLINTRSHPERRASSNRRSRFSTPLST